jgi:hypothetical protein
MIPLEQRIAAFEHLGRLLSSVGKNDKQVAFSDDGVKDKYHKLNDLCVDIGRHNTWFDEGNVRRMIYALGESLKKNKLQSWLEKYQPGISASGNNKIIGVVMAGNVPAVGFHDFLSVLITGHRLLAKLSSDDDKLLPAMAELLFAIEPAFEDQVKFTQGILKPFDAVIATGSNNTSRYFDYYFAGYPHIIRRNRNGVAVLTGEEKERDLEGLADDIFLFYGLGCRNVSKVYVPEGYDFDSLLQVIGNREEVTENHKYFNNYEYNKAIFLVNGTPHFDTGNLLVTENVAVASPVSVLHYEYYQTLEDLKTMLSVDREKIQCVVGDPGVTENMVPFGKSQQPELWDYADGVDTVEFLLSLA